MSVVPPSPSTRPRRPPAAESPDVLGHLSHTLPAQWNRYRKRLKRCQERFSEEAVHDSRVETRRLLATVELLRAFVPEDQIRKACRALKKHLDTFDDLRDTQVQLGYVDRLGEAFSAARVFHAWLRRRENRFTRETRRAVKSIRIQRLGRRIEDFERRIRRLQKVTPRARAMEQVSAATDRAFAQVAALSRRVKAQDSRTIHCTRIAFKRFRYMVEALSPLLPAVTEDHRRAMRGYQSMMGDIQDVEVMLVTLEKCIRKRKVPPDRAGLLRDELLRRREWLIQVYLNAAGKLRQFWPVPGLATRSR